MNIQDYLKSSESLKDFIYNAEAEIGEYLQHKRGVCFTDDIAEYAEELWSNYQLNPFTN